MKKVLLDENLPHTLRHHLNHHQTLTAAYAGLAGLKNGKLLDAAVSAGFDVLVTGDKTIQYEQNLAGWTIAVVSLSAVEWPLIFSKVAKIIGAVDAALPGSFTLVDCGAFSRRRPKPEGPSPA
ncbi:MAG: hypothetical protein JWO80_987 [Bryobacterales bacterium]|nr:hypothetical protein [Bryobacterales bacterium]